MENYQNYEQEIDLLDLIRMLFRRWYIIALSTILVLGVATAYSFITNEEEYISRGSIIIDIYTDGTQPATAQQLSEILLNTYSEVAVSDRVINAVIDNLNSNYTTSQMRGMISAEGSNRTSIVRLIVRADNPNEAQEILRELITVIVDLSNDPTLRNLQPVDILDEAHLPLSSTSSSNHTLNIAIGIVLGGMIGVFAVFMLEFLDRRIKTISDIQNKLNLRTLGVIPSYMSNLKVNHDEK